MNLKKLLVAGTLAGAALAVQAKDIVTTAVAAGNFKTLVVALKAADLVPSLKGKGPFTVAIGGRETLPIALTLSAPLFNLTEGLYDDRLTTKCS